MRSFLKNKLFILGFFILFGLAACDRRNSYDFLKIGSEWFSANEFFSQTPRYTFQYLTENQQDVKIENFINRQLLVYYAIDNNYQRLPDVRKRFRLLERRLLIKEYFDRMVLDSVITKQRLLSEYESLDPYKKDLFTYNDYKSVLKGKLIRLFSEDIRARYTNAVESLKLSSKFKPYQSNIDSLSKLFMSKLIAARYDSVSREPVNILKTISFNRPLYQINDNKVFLIKFIGLLSDFPLVSREERFSDPESLLKIIETVAINSYVYNQAKRLNLDKNDDFQQRLLFQKHNILYETAFSRKITGTISINDDTLRKFYAVHRDSLYMTKQRYEVQEIYITDKTRAENILNRALNNEDFQTLADTYTERYQNKPRKGYLGFIYKNTYADIGRCAAKTNIGQVYPELVLSGKGFSIIKLLSIEKPKPIPFNKIKEKVLNDCKKFKIKQKRLELLDSLKHKYSYYIDRSVLFN